MGTIFRGYIIWGFSKRKNDPKPSEICQYQWEKQCFAVWGSPILGRRAAHFGHKFDHCARKVDMRLQCSADGSVFFRVSLRSL